MNENSDIIRLLTDIRDAQREHLEEHRNYLGEAREHNKFAREHMTKHDKAQELFKSEQQLALFQQRQAVATARWQFIVISIGVIAFVLSLFF